MNSHYGSLGDISSIKWNQKGDLLVTSSWDGTVKVIDWKTKGNNVAFISPKPVHSTRKF